MLPTSAQLMPDGVVVTQRFEPRHAVSSYFRHHVSDHAIAGTGHVQFPFVPLMTVHQIADIDRQCVTFGTTTETSRRRLRAGANG